MSSEDKTEQATPRKLSEARKRGDIPTSPELTGAVVALVSLFALQQQGRHIVEGLQGLLSKDLAVAGSSGGVTTADIGNQVRSDITTGLLLLLPLTVAMLVGGAGIGFLNTRGLMSLKSLRPKVSKLNPINGFKHLFGKESLILALKAVVKLGIVVLVLSNWNSTWQGLLPTLPFMSVGATTSLLWEDATRISMQIMAAFFVVGAIDFGYRQFAWRKRQRMTKQEVKEEFKSSEGNPQVRARMRQIARKRLRALLGGGGVKQVPQADVVVTNPTHFAIAIQYKAGKMRAPKVIAKGQQLVALRIKEAARKHNIPIVENKPLAQALYKAVEVNQEVPADLYQAVAQVLAFVYRLRNMARVAQGGARRPVR